MKIGIIVGTRPEIIKMAPVIRECKKKDIPFFIIHSNQHYSVEMDAIFFKELELPAPEYNLGVGSGQHSNQTGNILIRIGPILMSEKPDVVLVQGDTNTVLAGALAASKLNIKVGHIEAGLRSYDRTMPEETNRILTDHLSDYLFAVGPNQEKILKHEGIEESKIHTVGNTVSDSLFQHLAIATSNSNILNEHDLESGSYFLVTAHRASNVDIEAHLKELLALFDRMHAEFKKTIVWPIHPRTVAKLKEFKIELDKRYKLIPPVGYMDFIQLQKHAQLILTDSGGIQEEACLLGVPCITLRDNTERPESVEVGANVLVGRNAEAAVAAAKSWLSGKALNWDNPFGDGQVAQEIIRVVLGEESNNKPHQIARKNETMSVIGIGYMGLPIACLLAQAGYAVTCVDIVESKVSAVNAAQCPFHEDGLPELLSRVVSQNLLSASITISSSDIYLIAVPTPHKDKACDRSFVFSAANAIADVAKDGQLVIIESTSSPQTCLAVQMLFKDRDLDVEVVYCPERAIPGQTLHELVSNDRIIGAASEKAANRAKTIYESFVTGSVFLTSQTTAECVKLVENTFRDVNIAFANELAEVCEELDVNVYEVIELANRHPRVNILSPGPGVGGHCIPIDPWFLVEKTKTGQLIRMARSINDERPIIVADKVVKLAGSVNGSKIGILGVAYKANVDDCRETPADAIYDRLVQKGFDVRYHDPFVPDWRCKKEQSIESLARWADTLILVTNHDCYKDLVVDIPILNSCS